MSTTTEDTTTKDTAEEKGKRAVARQAMKNIAKFRGQIDKHEAAADELRTQRDKCISQAAKNDPALTATGIASTAGLSNSYVSRVIRSDGNPVSGSAKTKGSVAKGVLSRGRRKTSAGKAEA